MLDIIPMLRVGVLEQLSQLQWVLAYLLNRREQEAIQGNINHFLQQTASLKEEYIFVDLHELGELETGVGVIITVF